MFARTIVERDRRLIRPVPPSHVPYVRCRRRIKIGACHASPVLRAAKALAETGWSKTTQDLVAKPVGDTGFRLEVK